MNCEIPVNKNFLQKLVKSSDSLNDVKKKKKDYIGRCYSYLNKRPFGNVGIDIQT